MCAPPSRPTSFRQVDAVGDMLAEGNILNLGQGKLDQHINRIMRESFIVSLLFHCSGPPTAILRRSPIHPGSRLKS